MARRNICLGVRFKLETQLRYEKWYFRPYFGQRFSFLGSQFVTHRLVRARHGALPPVRLSAVQPLGMFAPRQSVRRQEQQPAR